MTVAPEPPRTLSPQPQAAPTAPAEPRFHLTVDHDVVDGPTIGPKTAERLYPHGIKTVRDLMKAEPAALAVLLDNRHIMAETITDWQDQARLVCTVPGLRGTHAQLLVGASYRSAEAIAVAEADKLCADVLAFAASKDGQRVLRNGDPPDIEKIKGWLEAAQSVKAA
jgi:predicted flap endonuclease-1-like 5' DNA nuclease